MTGSGHKKRINLNKPGPAQRFFFLSPTSSRPKYWTEKKVYEAGPIRLGQGISGSNCSSTNVYHYESN